MADRFAALAGYAGDDTGTDFNSTAGGLTGLDEDSVSLAQSHPQPPRAQQQQQQQPPATRVPVPLGPRRSNGTSAADNATAIAAASAPKAGPSTPRVTGAMRVPRVDPPSTQRKQDARRLQGIRIADGDEAAAPYPDVDDSLLDDSELELQRMNEDLSRGADTTGAASVADDSGLLGSRAAKARGAAGISLKESEARIKSLQDSNNDLKVEVDLLRQRFTHGQQLEELLKVTMERQRLANRVAELQNYARQADAEVRTFKKMQKRWGDKDPDTLKAEARQALADLEEERQRREEAEEELDRLRRGGVGSEERDAKIQELKGEIEGLRMDHQDEVYTLRQENEELEAQVEALQDATRDGAKNQTELEELREDLAAASSENRVLMQKLDKLQEDKAELGEALDDHKTQLQEVMASEEAVQRELEVTKQRLEHIANESGLLADGLEAQVIAAEDAVTEIMQRQVTALRDELSAANVNLQDREARVDELEAEKDEALAQLEQDTGILRAELDKKAEACEQAYREADALDAEKQELEEKLAEFQAHIQSLEAEADKLDKDLHDTNVEVQELSNKNRELEEDIEVYRRDLEELQIDRDAAQESIQQNQERQEHVVAKLKERLAEITEDKDALAELLEEVRSDLAAAQDEADSMARERDSLARELDAVSEDKQRIEAKLEDLLSDLRVEEQEHETDVEKLTSQLEAEKDARRRELEEKYQDIVSLTAALASEREAVRTSKADVANLQDALRTVESESQRLGQSHNNDRYSLELEIERLKRDLERCEADLARARDDLERKEVNLREKDHQLSKLHADQRTMSETLAGETHGRASLKDKLEAQEKAVKDAQDELAAARAKVEELEHQLNQGERSMMQGQQQTRNQLTERNTLLLTIYQYMGKILGADKATPRKSVELKPFTNFGVFHDSLIARLHRISDIQIQFGDRTKAIEEKFAEQMTASKRQQDTRFRQIDRFEVAIKNVNDKQNSWRSRLVAKQSELEAAKATTAELQAQLASLRTRSSLASPGEANKLTSLSTRANNAERRLLAAQNQATQAEDRLADAKSKYAEGEGKWAARLKEAESRCKAAEERWKRERQGAKERVAELTEQTRRMERDLEAAKKRSKALGDLKDELARSD